MKYWDLFVPYERGEPPENLRERLQQLADLGYDGAAVTMVAKEPLASGEVWEIPDAAPDCNSSGGGLVMHRDAAGRVRNRPFKVLKRLHFVLSKPADANFLSENQPSLNQFDLVSAEATSDKLLSQLCLTLMVDVIVLPVWREHVMLCKAPTMQAAVGRGIVFELHYAPLVQASDARRSAISTAQRITRALRGVGISVAGGLPDPLLLRAPDDVASLCRLYSIGSDQSKHAISSLCERIIDHGEGRKGFRFALKVRRVAPCETPDARDNQRKAKRARAKSAAADENRATSKRSRSGTHDDTQETARVQAASVHEEDDEFIPLDF